jgi:hypothetical protein
MVSQVAVRPKEIERFAISFNGVNKTGFCYLRCMKRTNIQQVPTEPQPHLKQPIRKTDKVEGPPQVKAAGKRSESTSFSRAGSLALYF